MIPKNVCGVDLTVKRTRVVVPFTDIAKSKNPGTMHCEALQMDVEYRS